jgi:hypothetical protein
MSLVAGPLGYLGIAGLVAIESVGVPVPGETALITGGVLAHSGQLHVGVVIALGLPSAADVAVTRIPRLRRASAVGRDGDSSRHEQPSADRQPTEPDPR